MGEADTHTELGRRTLTPPGSRRGGGVKRGDGVQGDTHNLKDMGLREAVSTLASGRVWEWVPRLSR